MDDQNWFNAPIVNSTITIAAYLKWYPEVLYLGSNKVGPGSG